MASSTFKEREAALENAAVRAHDAELLARLREHGSGVTNVSIFGAGLMGSGIAQVSAAAGYNVHLIDSSTDALTKGKDSIAGSLAKVAKRAEAKGKTAPNVDEILSRISLTTDADAGVSDAHLVIEAIVENLAVKQGLFQAVEAAAPAKAVLASNTSSLKIGEIASSLKDPSRMGGLHYFNPVPLMPLVEVVSTAQTSTHTNAVLTHFGESVGKTVVQCKDTPGFVVNRLLVPYMAEAARMLERGDATMTDIDVAMKLGAGYPMGPFTLCDYVGNDTMKFILDGWHADHPGVALFEPIPLLNRLVEAGAFGNKAGKGFYKDGKPNPAFFTAEGTLKA